MSAREYTVSAYTVVNVFDDGSVSVEVELYDLAAEILDAWPNDDAPDFDLQRADSQRVAAAVAAGRLAVTVRQGAGS